MRPPSDPGHTGTPVRFFERAGSDARAVLERLGRRLTDGGGHVELLASDEGEDLWLLIARGGEELEPALDADTRCWRFRTPGA